MATAVVTRKSGAIALKDQQAEPYFLPNTLAQDKIVTSNVLTGVEVEPPVRYISLVYDFAPVTLNSFKPDTLTISYEPSHSNGKLV